MEISWLHTEIWKKMNEMIKTNNFQKSALGKMNIRPRHTERGTLQTRLSVRKRTEEQVVNEMESFPLFLMQR